MPNEEKVSIINLTNTKLIFGSGTKLIVGSGKMFSMFKEGWLGSDSFQLLKCPQAVSVHHVSLVKYDTRNQDLFLPCLNMSRVVSWEQSPHLWPQGLRSWLFYCVSGFSNSKLIFGSGTKLLIESRKLLNCLI